MPEPIATNTLVLAITNSITTYANQYFGEKGAEWVGAIATFIGSIATIAAVIFAIFQDQYKKWLYKPSLYLLAESKAPDCVIIMKDVSLPSGTISVESIQIRIRVKNIGNTPAEKTEVYLNNVSEFIDNKYQSLINFQPMNLVWSNIGGIYCDNIPPDFSKYCDLGFLLKLEPYFFRISSIDPPNNGSHLLKPGNYRLEILVAASNASHPVKYIMHLNFNQNFSNIISDNISIQMDQK